MRARLVLSVLGVATVACGADARGANEDVADEPVLGFGYHPGNFVGPLAVDAIVSPVPFLALDVQVGYERPDARITSLAVAPQVQVKLWRGWQTPYVGALYRREEVWTDGLTAASNGGALTAGWQFRWGSGVGVLIGGGVLYRSAIALAGPRTSYYAAGGWSGTYEVGLRYFF